MTTEIHNCDKCRYFLPTGETFYNKPCGYCGNYRIGKRRVSDNVACKFFEVEKNDKKKPDG